MGDPVSDRLAVQTREGLLGPSGVSRFRKLYASQDAASEFYTWRRLTGTKLLRAALQDLALHAPTMVDATDNLLVQYGMSLGLSLAARLVDDPSSVFPELFTGNGPTPGSQLGSFETFDADPFDDITQER